MAELRVAGIESQRHEAHEPARLILQLPDVQQVPDLLLRGLDVAVEHRDIGSDSGAVHRARDLEPTFVVQLGPGTTPRGPDR